MNRFPAAILFCLALLSGYAATQAARQVETWHAQAPARKVYGVQLDWAARGENARALRVVQEAPGQVRLPGIFYG